MAQAVTTEEEKTPAAGDSPIWNVLLPLLSFVGTGIGVIGFVIFFGGFVVWSRFDAAGVPANEAVARVPRNDLVATGASFLVPALLAALAAVTVAVVAWDALIGNRRRRRVAQAEANHAQAAAEAEKLEARAARVERKISTLRDEMERKEQAGKGAALDSEERKQARADYDEAEREYERHDGELVALQEREIPTAKDAERNAKSAKADAPKSSRSERLLQVAIGGIPMLVADVLIIGAGWSGLGWDERLLLIGVAAATVGVSIVVVSFTQHFAWYALSVFVGVGLLIAFSTYERTHSTVKVSPVAALANGRPVTGFFVAETTDALYVARPKRKSTKPLAFDHDGVTLTRFPESSVTDLMVGPLMEESRAYRRSLEVALVLCRQRKAATAIGDQRSGRTATSRTPPATTPGPELAPCPRSERSVLRDLIRRL